MVACHIAWINRGDVRGMMVMVPEHAIAGWDGSQFSENAIRDVNCRSGMISSYNADQLENPSLGHVKQEPKLPRVYPHCGHRFSYMSAHTEAIGQLRW